ncbi:MAG: ferredoxin, partial [Microthrixaceae bacterium]
MSLHIEIDREKCMGSGNCVYWAGDVFDVAEDMIAVVVGDPAAQPPRGPQAPPPGPPQTQTPPTYRTPRRPPR